MKTLVLILAIGLSACVLRIPTEELERQAMICQNEGVRDDCTVEIEKRWKEEAASIPTEGGGCSIVGYVSYCVNGSDCICVDNW